MKHADRIIERLLVVEGIPDLSVYDKINVGSPVRQQLANDFGLEEGALIVLKNGIKSCFDAGDNASRELVEHILVDEEEHVDWIETQLHEIEEVGHQNYLAQQIHKKG